jgi:hypothetical protein
MPPAAPPPVPPTPVATPPVAPAAPSGLPVTPPADASCGKNVIDPRPVLSTPHEAKNAVPSPTAATKRTARRRDVGEGGKNRIMIIVSHSLTRRKQQHRRGRRARATTPTRAP